MEKYGRVLVIIFFLCLINLGVSIYLISKQKEPQTVVQTQLKETKTNSPMPTAKSQEIPTDIKSDLTLIKAEIRALRESLESTGLITEPTPKQ